MEKWKLRDKLEKFIEDRCEEIPYEGMYIDRHGLVEDLMEWLEKDYDITGI
jgi:hypothetical protein